MRAVEHVLPFDFTAGVGSHAAHAGGDGGFHAADDFVVGRVVDDSGGEVVPLELIGILLGLGKAQASVLRFMTWSFQMRHLPGVWPAVLMTAEPLLPCA